MFNNVFDQLKEVKYFKENIRFQESYNVKYFKEINRLKRSVFRTQASIYDHFFVNILNGLLFLR